LPYLSENVTLEELVQKSGMKEVEVMRALQWLENKGVLKIKLELKEVVNLDKNGIKYKKQGLPEIRLLEEIKDKPRKTSELSLDKDEINISIGALKRKAAIEITKKDDELLLSITEQGKKLLEKESFEQKLLDELPLELEKLKPEQKFAYDNLKKRKDILRLDVVKNRSVNLTKLGKSIVKQKIDNVDVVETLTQQMIKDGTWEGKVFRAYDIKASVPKLFAGKRQPYMVFLNDIKTKLLSLGFKEMKGPLIELEFYNFDVLFQPQNHPARTWTDTYHLKSPVYGKLPSPKIVKAVKNAHENGAGTGS
jgi:phenylalanyl-tRNA synthetase alpha chain